MADWQHFDHQYGYEVKKRSGGIGCLLVGVGLFASIFVLIGLVVLLAALEPVLNPDSVDEFDLFFTGFGIGATVIGVIGIYAAFFNWKRDFRESVMFDKHAEEVRFSYGGANMVPYVIPFGDVERLHITREYKSSNTTGGSTSGTGHYVYGALLVLKNGSELIIEGSRSKEHTVNVADGIAAYTGFAVDSHSEVGYKREASASYEPRDVPLQAPNPHFYHETYESDGRVLTLRPNRTSPGARLIMFLALALFLGAPVLIFGQAFTGMGDGPGDIIFLVFAIPFCLIFYGIVGLVILMQLRTYRLILRSDMLIARLEFRFLKRFSTEIEIPADQVRGVQINRSDEGHYWLALGLAPDFRDVNFANSFMYNVGPFQRGVRSGGVKEEKLKRLSLWDASNLIAAGQGPSVHDLAYIAGEIRNTIGLGEQRY